MKILIITDNEGVCGVSTSEDVPSMETKEQLTAEVNAAIEGVLEKEKESTFLVIDAHGGGWAGHNVLHSELSPAAKLWNGKRGGELPYEDEYEFDALFGIGVHSKAGTAKGILNHTISSATYYNICINGRPVGEADIWASLAGFYNTPLVLITGDKWACEQIQETVPGIVTAAVKNGVNRFSGIHLPKKEACELIKKAAAEAVSKISKIKPITYEGPVEVRFDYLYSDQADDGERRGGTRIEKRSVTFTAENVWDAYHQKNTLPGKKLI
jgi:D-amino peptidase